jgi:hemerythrin-like domain-containing protein
MNLTITMLSYDHGIIRQVLDVLADLAAENAFDRYRSEMEKVSEFLLNFMDKYHHGREELVVFPISSEGGSELPEKVEKLIQEHRRALELAENIAAALQAGDNESLRENCLEIVAHMRDHIKEEEEVVFPKLEELLTGDKDYDAFELSQSYVEEGFGESFPRDMEEFANRFQDAVWGKGVIKFSAIKD